MSDPYREGSANKLQALLDDERALLVRAGKMMVAAGVLTVVAAIVSLPITMAGTWLDWLFELIPAGLGALTLQAGLVLSRLPGGGRDYSHIEKAVGSLRIVYTVKGALMLLVVGLACLAFISPMVLRIFM